MNADERAYYDEQIASLRGQLAAFLYMWGALSADAGRSPRIRKALLDALALAEQEEYLSAADATNARTTLDRWRAEYRAGR